MSIEFLNSKFLILKGQKKKNRGDEPNQAIIHIHMEFPQGNSLCSYLKQAKM
jgi:hypothetical protein